jgi:hypothetical protein
VFFVNLPMVAAAVWISLRHVPETRDTEASGHIDVRGGALLAFGLAGAVYALIEGPAAGWTVVPVLLGVAGVIALVGFVVAELHTDQPMVPLEVFRSRQFSGANGTTFAVYAALSAITFLLVVHLQTDMGYSALAAGASLIPITVLMLGFSARSGALAQRVGPRLQMTVGPVVVGAGAALLPGALVVAIGLTLTVAPLTAAVLGAIEDRHAGVGSAINNAVARIAGLLMIAVLPAIAGLSGVGGELDLGHGFARAMWITAGVATVGGVIAFLTIRRVTPVRVATRGDVTVPCQPECVREEAAA